MENTIAAYRSLRELGIREGDCCLVLPDATEEVLVVAIDLQSLREFIGAGCRGLVLTQWEVRMLAERMLEVAHRAVPSAFEDLYTIHLKGKEY